MIIDADSHVCEPPDTPRANAVEVTSTSHLLSSR